MTGPIGPIGPIGPAWYFLSDTHMGDGTSADDFGPSPQPSPNGRGQGEGGRADRDLITLCARIRAEKARAIVVGDLMELWQCARYDVESAHGEALEELASVTDVFVGGNHDWPLVGKKLFGVPIEPFFVQDGLVVFHGHQVDHLIRKHPILARVGSAVVGLLERLVHRDVDVWAETVESWFSRTGRYGANERYVGPVVHLAAKLAAQFGDGEPVRRIVFGHTHQKSDWSDATLRSSASLRSTSLSDGSDLSWSNCGTWTDGRRDYVILGTSDWSDPSDSP